MNKNIMGQDPLCYILKLMEIGTLVPKKRIFKVVFFTIYGHESHLVK